MKCIISILLLTLLLFSAGCKDETAAKKIIIQAESLYKSDPDSAYALLNTIELPDLLSEKLLARWCMIYGQVADTLGEEMPYTTQLTRALSYYKKHGTRKQQAEIGLYLGRSYVEDKEYEDAMKAYIPALEMALRAKDYNQAGYICSYMGDLYLFEAMPLFAAEKYIEAGKNFKKAGNKRSYAFALRDVGKSYSFVDSINIALVYLQKADTIVTSLGNTDDMAYIYNGLGNIYSMLDSFDLAEKYYLMSIKSDSIDNAPNYLALSEIYAKKGNLFDARLYLQKSSTFFTKNGDTSIERLYDFYELEKITGNTSLSLSYLEQYVLAIDSIITLRTQMDVIKAEKKYNHQRVLVKNMQLNTNKQHMIILVVVLITICLLLIVIYQLIVKRKNIKIVRQREALTQKDIHLLKLSVDLKEQKTKLDQLSVKLSENAELLDLQKSYTEQMTVYEAKKAEMICLNNELVKLKKEKLQLSTIAKRLKKLSDKVIPGADASLLSDKDWKLIQETVDSIYYPVYSTFLRMNIDFTSTELHYCYLVFFDLDTNSVAILMNIAPDSVMKGYQRLRLKLGITGGKMELYTYLTNLL